MCVCVCASVRYEAQHSWLQNDNQNRGILFTITLPRQIHLHRALELEWKPLEGKISFAFFFNFRSISLSFSRFDLNSYCFVWLLLQLQRQYHSRLVSLFFNVHSRSLALFQHCLKAQFTIDFECTWPFTTKFPLFVFVGAMCNVAVCNVMYVLGFLSMMKWATHTHNFMVCKRIAT